MKRANLPWRDESKDKEDAQEEDETKTRDLEGKQEKNDWIKTCNANLI